METVYMFVCRLGQQWGEGSGCLPDGDCRANCSTGHCLTILTISLSVSPAAAEVSGFICQFHVQLHLSILLSIGFTGIRKKLIRAK